MKKTALALASVVALATPAFAASNEVSIKFAPGSDCWTYEGRPGLKDFVGEFRAGQKVTATAAGEIFYSAGGSRTLTKIEPWDVSVQGPGGLRRGPKRPPG